MLQHRQTLSCSSDATTATSACSQTTHYILRSSTIAHGVFDMLTGPVLLQALSIPSHQHTPGQAVGLWHSLVQTVAVSLLCC